jgi:hypothetical protein
VAPAVAGTNAAQAHDTYLQSHALAPFWTNSS